MAKVGYKTLTELCELWDAGVYCEVNDVNSRESRNSRKLKKNITTRTNIKIKSLPMGLYITSIHSKKKTQNCFWIAKPYMPKKWRFTISKHYSFKKK